MGARAASNLSFAVGIVYFLLVPFAHEWVGLLLVQVLFSFALSVTNATLATLLTDAAPDNVRGTVLGVGSSLESIAGVSMPIVATAVFASFGPPFTGAISAFFVTVALALGLVAWRKAIAPPVA